MEDDGGLLILLFSYHFFSFLHPHLLWCGFLVLCGLFFSVLVLCFFTLPYFVGFQSFGLIVAQEGQIK